VEPTLLSIAFDFGLDLDSDFDLDREGHGLSRAEKHHQMIPASAAEENFFPYELSFRTCRQAR
jgi:hypothetical protein